MEDEIKCLTYTDIKESKNNTFKLSSDKEFNSSATKKYLVFINFSSKGSNHILEIKEIDGFIFEKLDEDIDRDKHEDYKM